MPSIPRLHPFREGRPYVKKDAISQEGAFRLNYKSNQSLATDSSRNRPMLHLMLLDIITKRLFHATRLYLKKKTILHQVLEDNIQNIIVFHAMRLLNTLLNILFLFFI